MFSCIGSSCVREPPSPETPETPETLRERVIQRVLRDPPDWVRETMKSQIKQNPSFVRHHNKEKWLKNLFNKYDQYLSKIKEKNENSRDKIIPVSIEYFAPRYELAIQNIRAYETYLQNTKQTPADMSFDDFCNKVYYKERFDKSMWKDAWESNFAINLTRQMAGKTKKRKRKAKKRTRKYTRF